MDADVIIGSGSFVQVLYNN